MGLLAQLGYLGLLTAASAHRGPPLPASTLDLGSLEWRLASGSGSVQIPTKLPYQAHLSLIDEGIIDDPNVGLNEGAPPPVTDRSQAEPDPTGTTRWVGEDQWTWSANLSVSKLSFDRADDVQPSFPRLWSQRS